MLLNHYAWSFHKWLGMLNALKVTKQCLLRLMIRNCWKSTTKYGKKLNVPIENASYGCLSLIMLNSIVKVEKKYYPQAFLKECKYEMKKTKVENLINDDLEKSSSDESGDESDNDSNDETESDNEIDNDESNV